MTDDVKNLPLDDQTIVGSLVTAMNRELLRLKDLGLELPSISRVFIQVPESRKLVELWQDIPTRMLTAVVVEKHYE